MIIRFFVLISFSLCFIKAQSVYFIKYKNSVPESRISTSLQNITESYQTKYSLKKASLKHSPFLKKKLSDENIDRIFRIVLSNSEDENEFVNSISSNEEIEYIQKSVVYKIDYTPDDIFVKEQYALEKIKIFDAWEITQGDTNIIVAIIDTGIDFLHEDLKANLFINHPEDLNKNGFLDEGDINGIDDDGNGFIDDVIGWDFTDRVFFPENVSAGDYRNRDNNPMDEHGHGTNVAGIIGAVSNNNIGISGSVPNVKMLCIKAFDPNGYGEEDDVASAILYAVESGAKIINMSFGDKTYSKVLRDVIKYAYSKGVVLVSSAGNSSSSDPHFPSGFDEVICVGASDKNDNIASFSNTGSSIDIVAPGVSVLTTDLDGKYSNKNGTSFSAPYVSSAAALILSKNNFNNQEIKQILKSTSDDISTSGWDEKSGAGRLNVLRALNVSAASAIKFNFPQSDYSTDSSSLSVYATILSPFFNKYKLKLGMGFTPGKWEDLISDGTKQVLNEEIFTIDLRNKKDTVYTLSLEIEFTNGRTTQERINFFLDHTPPVSELINLFPSFLGNKPTILASIYSNEPSVAKMFFRRTGETEFRNTSMDGFSPNSNFLKTMHFGFIPESEISEDSEYEVFFEVTNLGGMTTILNNENRFYKLKTDSKSKLENFVDNEYSLPSGNIYENIVNIENNNYVIINPVTRNTDSEIYSFNGNSFNLKKTINNRIVKSFGDFNNDGKTDLLSLFTRKCFIDEISDYNSFNIINRFSDTTGSFWPVLAEDIDSDGRTEVLSISSDTTITVYEVANDFNLNKEAVLNNFTTQKGKRNSLNSPSCLLRKKTESGKPEIWFFDSEGDLFSYNINGQNSYIINTYYETGLDASNGSFSSGDIDGDNIDEISVLLSSDENYDIATFKYLLVFNFSGNKLNILREKAFIDISSEMSSTFQNVSSTVKLADIDSDGKCETILFVYPCSYIFDDETNGFNLINIENDVFAKSVFTGDLNGNGLTEIAFSNENHIFFKEITGGSRPVIPNNLQGYSINSSQINLNFSSKGSLNYIYRYTHGNDAVLIDSTEFQFYADTLINADTEYFYFVKTKDISYPYPVSLKSNTISVFAHNPAKYLTYEVQNKKNIILEFDYPVSVNNLSVLNFILDGNIYPSSVSLHNPNAYFISFENEINTGEHNLNLKNLKDSHNSPIAEKEISFSIQPSEIYKKLFIENYSIINAYEVSVRFNNDITPEDALNKSNFSFSPENPVESLTLSEENLRQVNIRSKNPLTSVGIEYVLKISNIRAYLQPDVKIEEGAGSYIVIRTSEETLENIYVYPNPVKSSNNKLTFANLPEKAEIYIYDINGNFIFTVTENDGNGGAEWNLTDNSGKRISSGVYLFFARRFDKDGNIVEEKLEKFAVIR